MGRGDTATHQLGADRRAYLVPARGNITVNGAPAKERDGVAITDEDQIVIRAEDECEIVLVDLP